VEEINLKLVLKKGLWSVDEFPLPGERRKRWAFEDTVMNLGKSK
jgi:hypothetical protein